ncbi:MAG: NAD(P)-dependent alcohol dehydrogenase [Promethearchaeota archaeon]
MKAIIYTEYGPPEVLKLHEVDKPTPKDKEVQIRIYATTVNYGDLVARNFRNVSPRKFAMPMLFWLIAKIAFGTRKPRNKILGNEFSGVVEAVGDKVNLLKPGDKVFGYSSQGMKAYAEFIVLPEEKGILAPLPSNLSFEEAAVLPMGSIMALNLLKKVNLHPGKKILINGASGGIGSAAVQLAKHHFGAEVTGVCGTPRLEFVKSLGADKVIDYTKENFWDQSGELYDIVFDTSLGNSSFSKVKDTLKPNGIYLLAQFKMRQLGQMLRTKLFGNKKVICALSPERKEDLLEVKELIEAGKIKAVIDRKFPFEKMAEAHRYIEEGHKKGHIVVTLDHL